MRKFVWKLRGGLLNTFRTQRDSPRYVKNYFPIAPRFFDNDGQSKISVIIIARNYFRDLLLLTKDKASVRLTTFIH